MVIRLTGRGTVDPSELETLFLDDETGTNESTGNHRQH